MPIYSVLVTTTREVVVKAINAHSAAVKAAAYAHDVMPALRNLRERDAPVLRPYDYQSRTHDDAHKIPRDA